jgi:ribonuclease VapC
LIVVDASALVAIGELDPLAGAFLAALSAAPAAVISPISVAEAGRRLIGGDRRGSIDALSHWLRALSVEVWREAQDPAAVLAAYLTFGDERRHDRLNLGDCFAYALAKQLDAPLLYKGDHFARTDIRPALQPT